MIHMEKHFDLLVIGGGSGGIAAAVRAASLGAKVAIIEKNKIGGTCVNLGCVPKKIMWYSADFVNSLEQAEQFGFKIKNKKFDYATLVKNRDVYIRSLRKIYSARIENHKIMYLQGTAKFFDKHTLQVKNKLYSADHFIIATGTHPDKLAIPGAEYAMNSDDFFHMKKLPEKIVIIGSGYIAVELASILQSLGSKVKLILRNAMPLRNFDAMIGENCMAMLKHQGIELLPYHEVTAIKRQAKGTFSLHFEKNKSIAGIDAIFSAIGRSPQLADLNLKSIDVKTDDKGFIHTNKYDKTNIKHIYAIGDVAGKASLTPVAIATGRKLASRLFSSSTEIMHYENIPTVIFAHPPIGTVGLSEQDAIAKYGKSHILIHSVKFNSMRYGLSKQKVFSAMKLVLLKKNKKVLGCHIIDPHADEILQGFAVAIKIGATKDDLDHTVGIHPTSAEELVTMR
jgi:glutathione reductase (NADPH)